MDVLMESTLKARILRGKGKKDPEKTQQCGNLRGTKDLESTQEPQNLREKVKKEHPFMQEGRNLRGEGKKDLGLTQEAENL